MDLPSMSKVTKLSLDILNEKAKSTPVFAPGLDNLALTGAILATWDEKTSLAEQLEALLGRTQDGRDQRDHLGKTRNGRPKAADIAERVHDLALQSQ
jgi:malonate decarboxylase gamma subunit